MKAMVLAAGLGTRLRPLTDEISKPMIPVVNKPIMEHIIELLQAHNIRQLFVNLHYYAEAIRGYFLGGSRWGVDIWYSHEEELMGTAGGVKKVESYFRDDAFIVICGDVLTDINLSQLISFHKEKKALATIALTKVKDPSKYGVVITDEMGRIRDFQEKPSRKEALSNLASCGIYVFEPEILNYIPEEKFYDFGRNLFPLLVANSEPVYGFLHQDYWLDIGNPDAYMEGNFDALAGKVKVKLPGAQVGEDIWVGSGTFIADEVKLRPPLCIGRNCLVRNRAKLNGPVVIGDSNLIEEGAMFERGIKWENGHIGRGASILGGIIGDSTVVYSRARVLERAVIGTNCMVGADSVICEGARLNSNTFVAPGSEISSLS